MRSKITKNPKNSFCKSVDECVEDQMSRVSSQLDKNTKKILDNSENISKLSGNVSDLAIREVIRDRQIASNTESVSALNETMLSTKQDMENLKKQLDYFMAQLPELQSNISAIKNKINVKSSSTSVSAEVLVGGSAALFLLCIIAFLIKRPRVNHTAGERQRGASGSPSPELLPTEYRNQGEFNLDIREFENRLNDVFPAEEARGGEENTSSLNRNSKESKSDLQGESRLKNAKSVLAGLFKKTSSSTSAGSNNLDEELLRPGDAV